MLESFIITLREGVEGVLVVAIILTYLKKVGRQDQSRSVYLGVIVAIVGSVAGALALSWLPINPEAFEGLVLLLAAVFVGTMILWMWRHARHVRKEIEHHVDAIVRRGGSISWGLLLFTFLMIFREGVETVIFLGAVSFNTDGLRSFFGSILGLALAIAFGVFFVKGAIRVNLGRFFTVTSIVLLILAVQLIISGFHELGEAGWIPVGPREMALIGPIVKNNSLFVIAVLVLPLIILISSANRPIPPELTGPERRKQLAQLRRERLWKWMAGTAGVLVVGALTFNYAYSEGPKKITPPVMVLANGGEIKIPLDQLEEGKLHRFGFHTEGTVVRFIAVKNAAGHVSTALDTCEICGAYGYVQEGETILCVNCVADIYAPTIGLAGGCNPVPLESEVRGDRLVIEAEKLAARKAAFEIASVVEVIDPVCQMRLPIDRASRRIDYEGKAYYFCGMGTCAKEFQKDPARFLK